MDGNPFQHYRRALVPATGALGVSVWLGAHADGWAAAGWFAVGLLSLATVVTPFVAGALSWRETRHQGVRYRAEGAELDADDRH